MDITEAEALRLQEVSMLGDRLKDFRANPMYALLDEHIFKPIEQNAFNAFKKISADDKTQIIQAQIMSKVVDLIRQMIDGKINEGDLAKAVLYESTIED